MPLVNSNTYTEPTAGTSLNTARGYYNDSMRSLLTNFMAASRPTAVNLTADGAPLGEVDGMLYRSTVTNALYISDSVNKKSSPVGGNFTRVGIGHRLEASNTTLNTNRTTYEIGELVATLNDSRLYVRTSNTDALSSFVDVGAPRGYTMGALDNATFSGQSVSAIRFLATSNIAINTNSPAYNLDIIGDASISSNVSIGNYLYHKGDIGTYVGYPVGTTGTVVVNTASTERLRVDPQGNISVASSAYNPYKLRVTGNTFISSDIFSGSNVYAAGIYSPNATHQYNLYINNNQILTPGFNGVADIGINFTGFAGGTTQFRNLIVYNGKSTAIATFTGSTGDLTTSASITAAGNITAYSDERLKTNINTIDKALDKVLQLRGVSFKKDGVDSIGVIAQEVEKVIPEVVMNGEYKSVAYGNLVGLLIEAVKELQQRLNVLEKR